MANNCLVTKLKGVVNNPDLPKFNELRFKIIEESNFSGKWLGIYHNYNQITVTTYGGTFTVGSDSTVRTTYTSSNSWDQIKFSNGTYDVSIIGKYNMLDWNQDIEQGHNSALIDINIEDFKYNSLTSITAWGNTRLHGDVGLLNTSLINTFSVGYCSNLEGSWDGFTNPELRVFAIQNTKMGGNLSKLPRICKDISSPNNSKIYGSLDDLSDTTMLTHIYLSGCNNLTGGRLESLGRNVNLIDITISELNDYSGFNGSVEAFVSAQIAAGRTTRTTNDPIRCPWLLYLATFGGQKYQLSGYMFLTWDSASKITVYQGGNGQIANTTIVLAKGASASEIAAWEAAGKEVTVIS